MPKRKNYDKSAVARLFAEQGGLATRAQLIGLGVPPSTIRHRERPSGPWRRVLRGVCAVHDQALVGLGAVRAALLYAGPGSIATGFAALRAHGVRVAVGPEDSPVPVLATAAVAASPSPSPGTAPPPKSPPTLPPTLPPPSVPEASPPRRQAPDPLAASTVKVLIPSNRRRNSAAFVLVSRTRRMPEPVEIEGCRVAPVARAAVDACLDTKDTELIRRIVHELVHSGRCTVAKLRAELDANQTRRSARMRAVLVEFADGIRTGAQAQCSRRFADAAIPEPLWNGRVVEEATGRVAVLPGPIWPEHGVVLDLDPSPAGIEPAASRRRWVSGVLRMTVAHVAPSDVRERWDEVWAELRLLLTGPPTYRLPEGYAFA